MSSGFSPGHDIPVFNNKEGGKSQWTGDRFVCRAKRKERQKNVRLRRATLLRSPGVTLSHSGRQSRERTVSDETVCGSERTGNALTEHCYLEGRVVN